MTATLTRSLGLLRPQEGRIAGPAATPLVQAAVFTKSRRLVDKMAILLFRSSVVGGNVLLLGPVARGLLFFPGYVQDRFNSVHNALYIRRNRSGSLLSATSANVYRSYLAFLSSAKNSRYGYRPPLSSLM